MRRPAVAAVVAAVVAVLCIAGFVASRSSTVASAPPVASTSPTPTPTVSATSSATASPVDPLAIYYAQKPTWVDCGGGFQCTSISVPLDYKVPLGDRISLKLNRLRASDPSARIGSLLVNPGGPGVSGLALAREAPDLFSDSVRAAYDIVGFDPRGVGSSTPVKCLSAPQLDQLIAIDGSPDSGAEEGALLAEDRSFAHGCGALTGKLLGHVGTVDAARDMDVIRAVVGDSQLHYFGFSYGTFLGATYAEEFPTRVATMVLDGALDPTLDGTAIIRGQLGGFEKALDAFLADCVTRSDCPVGPTAADGRAQIAGLISASDAHPLRSDSGRQVTQSLVTLGVLYPLYDKQNGWPALRSALRSARGGNGTTLLAIADQYAARNPNGSYNTNETEANYAVNCLDLPDTQTLTQVRAQAVEFAKESPIFGSYFAWQDLPCTVWPASPTRVPHAIKAVGAKPILVVGTTRDPATPYVWAQGLAHQLVSGRLLTRDGDGHTAYHRGSSCIDDAIDSYLTKGTLPADGLVCQ